MNDILTALLFVHDLGIIISTDLILNGVLIFHILWQKHHVVPIKFINLLPLIMFGFYLKHVLPISDLKLSIILWFGLHI